MDAVVKEHAAELKAAAAALKEAQEVGVRLCPTLCPFNRLF